MKTLKNPARVEMYEASSVDEGTEEEEEEEEEEDEDEDDEVDEEEEENAWFCEVFVM